LSIDEAIVSETDRPGTDVILFDLGGVLMNFGGLQRLAELSGEEDGPALRSKWVTSKWVKDFERGKCDADAFGEGVVREWGLDLTSAEFVDDFARWSAGPFEGSVDLVRSLHGTVRMGCLSNTNPVHWQRHLDRWGLVDYFDWTFVSHQLRMMKPDPEIFQHVIRTVGTTAERLLFLDDCNDHVQAARKLGIRAEQTRGVSEVRDALVSLLPADSSAVRALQSPSSRPHGG
jgi:glucose-1-phosphatase